MCVARRLLPKMVGANRELLLMRRTHERGDRLSIWVAMAAFAAALFFVGSARAELEIAAKNGWRLSTDGRINTFLSFARGNAIPSTEQLFTGLNDERTADQKIESARVRTGFIESTLGFELNRKVNPSLNLKARVALWILAASARSAGDTPGVEAREAYFKIEGDWGGFLAGRAMSLFSRGAILLNYDIEHAYGL